MDKEEFVGLSTADQLERVLSALEDDEPDADQVVSVFLELYSPDEHYDKIKANQRAIKESGVLDVVLEKLAVSNHTKNFLNFMRILSLLGKSRWPAVFIFAILYMYSLNSSMPILIN
jgi:hypothetical protein